MAGEEGLEERTEEASAQRREEWKKDGNVSQSRELSGALLLLASTGVLYASSKWSLGGVHSLFTDLLGDMQHISAGDWTEKTALLLGKYSLKMLAYIIAPVVGATFLIGIVASIAQTGFVWTTKPLTPDLERLSPMKGLSRLIGLEGVFEMFKAITKFVVVGFVAYTFLSKWIRQAGGLWDVEANGLAVFFVTHIIQIMLLIGGSMFLLALIDFGFQKFRYEQKIKMTRQEAKEERKQNDGNPAIKARIRGVQRQMANRRMMDAVKKADVIITNPTHIAVAIVYDRENMFAPKVVAKGADHMAERIKKIAREAGVPCVENVPLARAMYKALKIGQFISRDLYNAVAEVLAYVYRIKGRNL